MICGTRGSYRTYFYSWMGKYYQIKEGQKGGAFDTNSLKNSGPLRPTKEDGPQPKGT